MQGVRDCVPAQNQKDKAVSQDRILILLEPTIERRTVRDDAARELHPSFVAELVGPNVAGEVVAELLVVHKR